MSQLSDDEVKDELFTELSSRLGRIPAPEPSALHYRAFGELLAELEGRGWRFSRRSDESGTDYIVVETRGA